MKNIPWIRIPNDCMDALVTEPETGRMYQIVDITMKDKRVIKDCVIINCCHLAAFKNDRQEDIEIKDISEMKVTHKKWEGVDKVVEI